MEKELKKNENNMCSVLKRYQILSWANGHASKIKTAAFAFDTEDNTHVFIKFGLNRSTKKKVRTEIQAIMKLTEENPNYMEFLSNLNVGLPDLVDYYYYSNKRRNIPDGSCHYLVTPAVGTSLEILHERQQKPFSIGELSMLALRMLKILEYTHGSGYIHSDIHPGNVVLYGDLATENHRVILIDFGVSGAFMDGKEHIVQSAVKDFVNSHKSYCFGNYERRNLSRKDDIEMLALMLIDLHEKVLPYHTKKIKSRSREDKLKFMSKIRVPKSKYELLQLPSVFCKFVLYARELHFTETPDYAVWMSVFGFLAFKQSNFN